MPKHKLFCFDCRTTKRIIRIACTNLELSDPTNTCQHCGKEMIETYNYPTPRKSRDSDWRKLESRVRKARFARGNQYRLLNAIHVANKMTELRNQK